jgi:hypothetical protein
MRRSPVTVLVCLSFLLLTHVGAGAGEYINVVIKPPMPQSDLPATIAQDDPEESVSFRPASAGPTLEHVSYVPRRSAPPGRSITKCKPPVCEPPLPCVPSCGPTCMLPKRMYRQWELGVQVFFANVRGTIRQGGMGGLIPLSDIDFTNDLGLPSSRVLLDYSARYQFAPHWAIFYAAMPIELEANKTLDKNLYYRQWILPYGTRVHTKWNFLYQRVGLLYQPILTCNSAVSVFAGWMFNDQWVTIKNFVCSGREATVSRTRQMATSGLEIQKCLKTKCTGATLSCDSRVGVNFLDGVFGVDVQAGLRYSVPMGPGRWGYARGGYRYLSLGESRDDLRLDAIFEGGFVEGGLIF